MNRPFPTIETNLNATISRLGVLRCAGCNGRMSIGDDWRGLKVYR